MSQGHYQKCQCLPNAIMWHTGIRDPESLPVCQLSVICSPVQDEPQSGKQGCTSGMLGRSPNNVESLQLELVWILLSILLGMLRVLKHFCLSRHKLFFVLVSIFKEEVPIDQQKVISICCRWPDVKRHPNTNRIWTNCFHLMSDSLHFCATLQIFECAIILIWHVFCLLLPTAVW